MFKKAILRNASSVLLASCLSVTATFAQEEHPIDMQEKDCMDKSSSTDGMVDCTYQAYKNWDTELNRLYESLMEQLDKPGKKALRKAQRAWIKYRDAEIRTVNAVYGLLEGTMWGPVAVSNKMDITEKRALALKNYLKDLEVGR